MDSNILLIFRYLGISKIINLHSSTTYASIIEKVIGKWPDLANLQFTTLCVVGDMINVCLENEEDLLGLKRICEVSNVIVVRAEVDLKVQETASTQVIYMEDVDIPSHPLNKEYRRIDTSSESDIFKSNIGTSPRLGSVSENDEVNCTVSNSLLSDNWDNLKFFCNGQPFYGTVSDFRIELIKYSTKLGFKYKFIRNSPKYIRVECAVRNRQGCKWFLKAKFCGLQKALYVYGVQFTHTCNQFSNMVPSVKKLTSRIIGDLMIPNVQKKPSLNAMDVINAMEIRYGVQVPYTKARRAADFAKVKFYGDYIESYDTLQYYCLALEKTNPGSIAAIEVNQKNNKFERLFIGINASIRGFQFCPPLIFVDGTFLRGPFKGILLVAVAKDGNRGLFPVAFGVVSCENTPNWSWFLLKLKQILIHEQEIFYLSDRNSGLMKAFEEVHQDRVHFFCIYHLLANLKARYCTGLKAKQRVRYIQLFKDCAYETDPLLFLDKVKQFLSLGGAKATEWLSQMPYHMWAICYSPQLSRFGEMTSNAAESFNAWILPARYLPITKMIDFIRIGLAKWIVQRRIESNRWEGALVPDKEHVWKNLSSIGFSWPVLLCPASDYEVFSCPSTRVDLKSRSCTCNAWQVSGFPCSHAVAVIRRERSNLDSDVEVYFMSNTYRKCYGFDINPIPDTLITELQRTCPQPKVFSPDLNRPIGRPKGTKRIPSVGEHKNFKRKRVLCSRCGIQTTHDPWSCPLSNLLI